MQKTSTVLMTADTIGGVWGYSLELMEALSLHGVQFVLATMGDPLRPSQREQLARLENVTLEESCFALEWMEDPWEDVARAGQWLLMLEQRHAPDLIHLNGYTHASLPFTAPVVVVAHSCVWTWWKAVHGAAPPQEWKRYRRNVERGLGKAAAVVAPTRSLLDAMREHYDFATPSAVIPNGRKAAPFRPAAKEPFVLSAGRLWDEAKNIDTLVAASRHFEWPLLVAGDAGDRPMPEAGRARFLGRLSEAELAESMSRAAIFALPALYEPFGLSILEAALSGCALVVGDIDTLREVWGDAAVYVNPRDEHHVAAAISSLIADEPARRGMADAATRRASQYSVEAFGDAYMALYESLAVAREVAV